MSVKLTFSPAGLNASLSIADLQTRLDALATQMENQGTEEDWKEVLLRDDMALPHSLADVLCGLKPTQKSEHKVFDKLCHILHGLSLPAPRVSANLLAAQHEAVDTLGLSLVDAPGKKSLVARLRLLTLILSHCPSRELRMTAFDDTISILLKLLSKHKGEINELTLEALLLFNHHDTRKRVILTHLSTSKGKNLAETAVKHMKNQAKVGHVSHPALQFVRNVFDFGRTDVLSDKYVQRIFDVLLDKLNTTDDSEEMAFEYLVCLESVISWEKYGKKMYEVQKVRETLAYLDEQVGSELHFRKAITAVEGWIELAQGA